AKAGLRGPGDARASCRGGAAQRFPHLEGEDGEEEARNGREEEGGAPTELLRDEAAAGKAECDPDRASGPPDRSHAAALLLGEVVGEERGAGGIVAGFADADDGPAQEELEVAAREAGEEGGDAPDGHADADHGLADAAVAPVPEGEDRKSTRLNSSH